MWLGEQSSSRAPNPELNHTWHAQKTMPEIALWTVVVFIVKQSTDTNSHAHTHQPCLKHRYTRNVCISRYSLHLVGFFANTLCFFLLVGMWIMRAFWRCVLWYEKWSTENVERSKPAASAMAKKHILNEPPNRIQGVIFSPVISVWAKHTAEMP